MQYSRLSNGITTIEGTLRARTGIASIATVNAGTALHTIFRLNQQTTAISPERIVGSSTKLFSQQLPSGAFEELTGLAYDGLPLSILPFRFGDDPSAWAIIGNSQGMRKRRRPSLYYLLGIVGPNAPVTAVVGAAGAITGTAYDWRATYVCSVTNSESNPSGLDVTLGDQRPTTNTTPDPISGGGSCPNPANAYDGSTSTYSTFIADSTAGDPISATESARYFGWAALPGTVSGLTLNISSDFSVVGTSGYVIASMFYSTDGGTSWNTIYSSLVARSRLTDSITLPNGVDLTKLIVRAVAFGAATAPSNGGGGGDHGGGGCPLSGAPVRLYGDPEWWWWEAVPQEDFIHIKTETGREGWFDPNDRRYSDHGLLPLNQWEAGWFAIVDEPDVHLERVVLVEPVHIEGATKDSYHAREGHVYSAWGFMGHNNKPAPE